MRGHDDLAILGDIHPPQQLQEFDLARRRQRRFRFVEDEDALTLAALLEKAQESLAVGMREEVRRRALGNVRNFFQVDLVQVSRNREEALSAEEPTVGDLGQPTCTKRT